MPILEEMTSDQVKDEIFEKSRKGWIKAWFAIEVMAVNKELAESSLKNHIETLEKVKEVFVFEKDYKPIEKVEYPPKNVPEAYSQVVELRLFVKDLTNLINIVIAFGPSSIEILEPKEVRVRIDEVQSLSNLVAGLLHQFAAAGVGGMVITPPKKPSDVSGHDVAA